MDKNYGKEMSIEEVRKIQISILDEIHSFCEKNGIRYFITAGTLIGAVRHKGYIPWDDDIDIVMLRDDYDRMVKEFNVAREDHFRLASHENDISIPYAFAKVYDNRTIFIENDTKNPIGINVDIFPLENITDNYSDAVKMMKKIKKYAKIVEIKNIVRAKKRSFIKKITLALLQGVTKIFSYKWCFKHIDKIAKKHIDNKDSKYVAHAVTYAKGEREIVEREWFFDAVDLEFEGKLYKAPVGYDSYLRRLFGDYMQMPPKEQQVSHHFFKAYLKNDNLNID